MLQNNKYPIKLSWVNERDYSYKEQGEFPDSKSIKII